MPWELEAIVTRGQCRPGRWRDGCARCSGACATGEPWALRVLAPLCRLKLRRGYRRAEG